MLICEESESECRNQQGVMDLLGSCKTMWANVGLCSVVHVFTLLSRTLAEGCRCGVSHRPDCGLSYAACGVSGGLYTADVLWHAAAFCSRHR